jgi:hypothetical protein
VYSSSSGPVDGGFPIWTAEIKAYNKKDNTYTVFFPTDEETLQDVPWQWIVHEGSPSPVHIYQQQSDLTALPDVDHPAALAIRNAFHMRVK